MKFIVTFDSKINGIFKKEFGSFMDAWRYAAVCDLRIIEVEYVAKEYDAEDEDIII